MARTTGSPAHDLFRVPRLGPVDLRVTDPDRAAGYWTRTVGPRFLAGKSVPTLGFPGRPMVRLHPGDASPMPEMALGLFHLALNVPGAADLAEAAR